jgi:hypothetical protein
LNKLYNFLTGIGAKGLIIFFYKYIHEENLNIGETERS